MNLLNKVVLITGASEGIGAACVASFRSRGARLALVARRENLLRQLASSDGLAIAADLTRPEDRRRAVEQTLAHFGALDVLVNNAGVGLYQPAHSAALDETRAMFDLNFFAPLAMAQLAAVPMRRQGSGVIVNVSSIAGKVTLPWLSLYSASKHALIALTEALRMELGRDGIHAMSVCPGYVDTGFQSHALAGKPPLALRRGRPFSITAKSCAEAIVRGVERKSRTVVTPRTGWLFVAASRLAPALVERRLERMNST